MTAGRACPGAVVRVAPVEVESPSRDDAADLVVTHAAYLAAELPGVFAERPGEIVHQLNRRVVIDERGVALLARTRYPGDANIGNAPVERVVTRNVDAEVLDHVFLVGARGDVAVDQPAQPETNVVDLVRPECARVG